MEAAPFRFAVGQPVSYAEDGKPETWKGGYDIDQLSDLGSRAPQHVMRNADQSHGVDLDSGAVRGGAERNAAVELN